MQVRSSRRSAGKFRRALSHAGPPARQQLLQCPSCAVDLVPNALHFLTTAEPAPAAVNACRRVRCWPLAA